jgi:hypothetical protein
VSFRIVHEQFKVSKSINVFFLTLNLLNLCKRKCPAMNMEQYIWASISKYYNWATSSIESISQVSKYKESLVQVDLSLYWWHKRQWCSLTIRPCRPGPTSCSRNWHKSQKYSKNRQGGVVVGSRYMVNSSVFKAYAWLTSLSKVYI